MARKIKRKRPILAEKVPSSHRACPAPRGSDNTPMSHAEADSEEKWWWWHIIRSWVIHSFSWPEIPFLPDHGLSQQQGSPGGGCSLTAPLPPAAGVQF